MIVVSDTSPLNYLVLIGEVEVLWRLYGAVVIPEAVYEELTRPKTPDAVRQWMLQKPDWVEVRAAPALATTFGLDPGEEEAIALAVMLQADLLLADDSSG